MEHALGDIELTLTPQAGGSAIWRFQLDPARLPSFARAIQDEGGQLLALWGADDRHLGRGYAIHVAFLSSVGLIWSSSDLAGESPRYPDLAHIFPQADRMQRAACDLLGIRARDAADDRKWLRHKAWAEDEFPLRKDFSPLAADRTASHSTKHASGQVAGYHRSPLPEADAYPFLRVDGDGVHEIPVGPIHAGTIEPGHFRFSIIGDRILKLEERLGYTHKGTEKRFEGLDLATGAKLAGRVSGDAHTAFSWAYCMAAESACRCRVPDRAAWLRALFLEIERVANHLGDLGYLGNDVALAFGFMQFWRLKEDWLRLSARLFGHRYLFDCIVPGGVTTDIDNAGRAELRALGERIAGEVRELKHIYDEHTGLQDRFAHTGIVKPELAARLGLTGLAGRASSQAWDARVQFPCAPYDQLDVTMAVQKSGDVLARAEVRFAEIFESLRLIGQLLARLPDGELRAPCAPAGTSCEGLGWVEGWRGPTIVALRIAADGTLDRVHPHDPSWQNWPLLEVGVLGNIVPDFPLINKSFNLSYSGVDL